MSKYLNRRDFLRRTIKTSAGALVGLHSFEEENILVKMAKGEENTGQDDTMDLSSSSDSKLPFGMINNLKISRLFCGGNLIGGWAHSRDLTYVSSLVKAYHSDEKIFETLELAEEMGINTILTNPVSDRVINRYWNERGGSIQWISDCALSGKDIKEGIKRSADNGAHAVYVQGGIADLMVHNGKIDFLGEALEHMRMVKVPGGIGAHCLTTVKACVKAGIKPDFWVKTLHPETYWSATPRENREEYDEIGKNSENFGQYHDNMWCVNPAETIEYMKKIKQPWIAFKTMAAGAIHPRDGFKFALEGGADFICAGMFDFQTRENAMIARDILSSDLNRQRSWRS